MIGSRIEIGPKTYCFFRNEPRFGRNGMVPEMIGSRIQIDPKTYWFFRDEPRFERNKRFLDQSLSWNKSSLSWVGSRDVWNRDWSQNLLFLLRRSAFRKKWDGSIDDWFQDTDRSKNLLFLPRRSAFRKKWDGSRNDWFQDTDRSKNQLVLPKPAAFQKK